MAAVRLLLLLLTLPGTLPLDSVIIRQNMGVVFVRHSILDYGHSTWTATFTFKLPDLQNFEIPVFRLNCSEYNIEKTDCVALNVILEKLQLYHEELADNIKETLRIISEILPHESQRSRRALFGFLGQWLHDLTGTMDQDQAHKIDENFKRLKTQAAATKSQLLSDEKRFATYVDKSGAQFDLITTALKNVTSNIVVLKDALTIQSGLMFQIRSTVRLLINVQGQVIAASQANNRLIQLIAQLRQGIHTLLSGYLPQEFVSPQDLEQTLKHIQAKIGTRSRYEIVYLNPAYYYHVQNIAFRRIGNDIVIVVPIPIRSSESTYTVYSVRTFPTPLNHSGDGRATIVRDLPHFLAVSNDFDYYMHMHTLDLMGCQGRNILECRYLQAARGKNIPSCAYSLFIDDIPGMKRACNLSFEPALPYQIAVNLGQGKYLITGPRSNAMEVCHGSSPRSYYTCSLCTVHVKCGCAIHSDDFYLPAALTDCHTESSNRTHGINLGYLSNFPSELNLNKISASTTYEKPPTYLTELKQIRNVSNTALVKNRKKFALDLNSIARSQRENSITYADEASFTLEHVKDTSYFGGGFSSSLELIYFGYMILSAIAIIWICLRLRVVGMIQQVPAVRALALAPAPAF